MLLPSLNNSNYSRRRLQSDSTLLCLERREEIRRTKERCDDEFKVSDELRRPEKMVLITKPNRRLFVREKAELKKEVGFNLGYIGEKTRHDAVRSIARCKASVTTPSASPPPPWLHSCLHFWLNLVTAIYNSGFILSPLPANLSFLTSDLESMSSLAEIDNEEVEIKMMVAAAEVMVMVAETASLAEVENEETEMMVMVVVVTDFVYGWMRCCCGMETMTIQSKLYFFGVGKKVAGNRDDDAITIVLGNKVDSRSRSDCSKYIDSG
ncbi:hypothetical protein DY000_02013475 [Brassica cretica]|uniref:Uncharacterized protein n=1 Tax=Brassica cretica TaxID=69181 RepID=A0ABQ7D2W9_BRACR|nr:hypothetical protein DY000_02013475 [Brassica cretica]